MNSLGKNYLAALAVFIVVLAAFLVERNAALTGMAKEQGVTRPQLQDAPVGAPTSATIDNLTPPPATLTPPTPDSTAPSIDLAPRSGDGS